MEFKSSEWKGNQKEGYGGQSSERGCELKMPQNEPMDHLSWWLLDSVG